jgi:C-terminal processing protease CtpA/Prc
MRITTLLLLAAALPGSAAAQVRVYTTPRSDMLPVWRGLGLNSDGSRVAIGVTTTSAANGRDTLGVLVTAVRADSPAARAGIGEGDRIASINGVSLKLSAADIGAYEMAGVMSRRLTRELNKLRPGDEVELRLYANGQNKTLRVKTETPENVYAPTVRRRDSDRATLGISIGTTGSSRDTLGVFVMSVDDDGPAAKAGIEEGSRIASINGVDVRGRRDADDEEDYVLRAANVNRLEREMAKVKPGDDVDLRVYYAGQFKNVKVKTVAAADLPRHARSITIIGGDNVMRMPAMASVARMPDIGRTISSSLAGAFAGFGIGNRVVW